jgi:hypothetical protein
MSSELYITDKYTNPMSLLEAKPTETQIQTYFAGPGCTKGG